MNNQRSLFIGLLFAAWCFIVFSCNNNGVSPTSYSRLQVINAIPGSLSFDCTLNYTKINSASIAFPGASGYISIAPGSKHVEIRPTTTPTAPFIDSTNVVLKQDSSYSLFFTGQNAAYNEIFIRDNLSVPPIGRAKIRFVNTSVGTAKVDITINAVVGFTNIPYKGIGQFIEVPAGTYEFKAFTTGTATNLTTLSNQVLADGKIYTLYAQGIVGNTTTSAFGLSLITNLLPAIK